MLSKVIIQLPEWNETIYPSILTDDPTLLNESAARQLVLCELEEYISCHLCGALAHDEVSSHIYGLVRSIECQIEQAFEDANLDYNNFAINTVEFIDGQGSLVAYAIQLS